LDRGWVRIRNKIVLWPAYFDSTKARSRGRKVPKRWAVPSPTLDELQKAVQRLGLKFEVVPDACHPATPWQRTGLLLVPKKHPKTRILREVARELRSLRGQP